MSVIKFLRPKVSNGLNSLMSELRDSGKVVKKINIRGSRFTGNQRDIYINWGRTDRAALLDTFRILNDPEKVKIATSKIDTFSALESAGMGNNLPKWTTSIQDAERWIMECFDKVYCRTLTRSSQGRGIVVAETTDELVRAPLYTSQVDVDREVRVHVFIGQVIDFAQKKRMSSERLDVEGIEVNDNIRSHSNGWVFAREGVSLPENVKSVAIAAISAMNLDFGAVDIGITPQGVPKIYEVNSAPGLEGTTLQSYKNAILEYVISCNS